MVFATDRDLLVLEPNVFRDVVFDAQVLARASDGAVSGTVLTSAGSDFAATGVGGGAVAVVGGVALEVVERLSATTLSVSRLRESGASTLVPPPAGADLDIRVSTFGPQIAEASARVTRALGLTGDDEDATPEGELTRAVALGALGLVYAAAATNADTSDPNWARSVWFHDRAREELRRVRFRFDSDGDGVADAVRRVQPSRLVRE